MASPRSALHDEESALLPASVSKRTAAFLPENVATTLKLLLALVVGFSVGCLVVWKLQKLKNANNAKSVEFLVVGDWGREGLYNQSQVATQMGRIGKQLDIQFVISTGDNFYQTGLKGVDDPLFARSFTNVYTASSLQTTWYTVLGNHDYMGDVIAQLSDEIVSRDPRWFCRREFKLQLPLCEHSETCEKMVDMFFIDTTPFIDEYWAPNMSVTFDWRGLAPRKNQLFLQLQNLTKGLRKSTATWKIVVGHHTMRSIGHHGDSQELLSQVLPILESYGVDVYINGHDHNLQYIKRLDSPIHFITSGGGSKAWSGLRPVTQENGVQFAFDGQGFVAVSIKSTSLYFAFYDVFGEVIGSFSIRK